MEMFPYCFPQSVWGGGRGLISGIDPRELEMFENLGSNSQPMSDNCVQNSLERALKFTHNFF